ncbi:TIGR00266 family protein [Candidatus Woesearchaeota archaeon]|nr:TIGR00266 family protein [Candidatus Woesearchaeota archaeon]
MKYKLLGTVMPTVNIELKKGEKVFSQTGGMSWMSNNLDMDTGIRGGFWRGIKRLFSGESFFLTNFSCIAGTGIITFSSEYPGKIIPVQINKGKEYICQKDAFLCAENGVNLDVHFRARVARGLFGGEGFVLQKLSGKGTAFVNFGGEVVELNLKKGQEIKIDTGHVAMYEPSVDYDVAVIRGIKNIIFGSEGLFFATLKGPGKVWLQSMPVRKLAARLVGRRGKGNFIWNLLFGR